MTTQEQTKVRERWTKLGLSDRVQDDLINLAAELAEVAGVPLAEALDEIETEVRQVMRNRILNRAADTITYNGDLQRNRGGGEA